MNGRREKPTTALMKTDLSPRRPLSLREEGARLSPGCHLPLCVLCPSRDPPGRALLTQDCVGAWRVILGKARRCPVHTDISREQPRRSRVPLASFRTSPGSDVPRGLGGSQTETSIPFSVCPWGSRPSRTETVSSLETREKRGERTPFPGLQCSRPEIKLRCR